MDIFLCLSLDLSEQNSELKEFRHMHRIRNTSILKKVKIVLAKTTDFLYSVVHAVV